MYLMYSCMMYACVSFPHRHIYHIYHIHTYTGILPVYYTTISILNKRILYYTVLYICISGCILPFIYECTCYTYSCLIA